VISLVWGSLLLGVCAVAVGQVMQSSSAPTAAESSHSDAFLGVATSQVAVGEGLTKTPSEFFGLWAIAPAIVAIGLAMITRQVLLALPLGILTGAVMMCVHAGIYNPLHMFSYCVEHYLLGVLFPLDPSNPNQVDSTYKHLQTLVFTQFIGAMIGVIEANGGTRAMVAKVVHLMKSRRHGQLGALGAGCVIFFDDYANALIIGPAMRPVFDRLRLSREKLAYIVDSTSAPVASLCIGTWLAAEINFLDGALADLGDLRPAFLEGINGAGCFWNSVPYRTYAILALFMVFLIGLTGRDFGPMRKAETRAQSRPREANGEEAALDSRRWYLGFIPVFVLVTMAVTMLLVTGYQSCTAKGLALDFNSVGGVGRSIVTLLGEANSYVALIYSGLAAAALAVFSTLASRSLRLSATFEGVTNGMSRVFGAQVILVLAWGLSAVTSDLQLGQVASGFLQTLVEKDLFNVTLLPMSVFLTSCIVSFATGTSWGTMGILCPTAVAISAHMLSPMPVDHAMPLFFATVGAVLAGAVFGDHCSPVSDTTILSSLATECPLDAHVRTQLPYALATAFIGLLGTDVLNYLLIRSQPEFYYRHWNAAYGLVASASALLLFVLFVGRRPKAGVVVEPSA